jgi:23S rRNA (guanosine2251-2'-O)-methyltransferase
MVRGPRHQGVAARVTEIAQAHSVNELLEGLRVPPLLLVLDGVTDPHNLGACLRVADAAGAHAVIAPKDRAAGLGATAAKVASGAAETLPYLTVTNLARTLEDLKARDVWVIGADADATEDLFTAALPEAVAWVLGAEGHGMRRLTRERCDLLVRIPMLGTVESLNVAVAAGLCLFESQRRRAQG